MNFVWDVKKEESNKKTHGLDFSFAEAVFADPLRVTAYDRFENGEDRYHALGIVGGGYTILLVVYAMPDPDDDELIRVISLRQATARERKNYAEHQG